MISMQQEEPAFRVGVLPSSERTQPLTLEISGPKKEIIIEKHIYEYFAGMNFH